MPKSFLSTLTGSFSTGAAENPTVAMVEAAYRHHGLDIRYINCEVPPDLLGDAVRGARAMGWVGFNCSLPHKVTVIEHLDGLGESAEIMGAVNCAVRRGDQLIGENTDGKGFLKSLMEKVDPRGKSVVMFGAGGAARAIGVELALAGATRIVVVNRGVERGQTLVDLLNAKTEATAEFAAWSGPYAIPDGTDIVVNATSIGLYPDVDGRLDIDLDTLKPGMVVADVIVNPPKTNLLRDAEARGCTVVDGLGMLINQGVIGIKYWTGVDADPTVMRDTLTEIFGASD
ncbi:shikimate dehydrogenase [Bauldia litoralis]|uniref:Shikimate dehydrogenase (NADP(+)) n=1 Tax=Bauldia litoralis TaxID=665467 RepID=A0A1G6D9N4_9HYPH|nr:shikimate dehydrogenase [Bauldia litoralis]SDB41811.1 shikimate dehydrogenase [Bauldia litoralis]